MNLTKTQLNIYNRFLLKKHGSLSLTLEEKIKKYSDSIFN